MFKNIVRGIIFLLSSQVFAYSPFDYMIATESCKSCDGCDLSNTNLSGANLSGSNITGADLSGVNLAEVLFYGVNLTGLQLIDANLLVYVKLECCRTS